MNQYDKVAVIIPAYDPDQKLICLLHNLKDAGFVNIILVNDGSKKECDSIFAEAQSILENLGGGISKAQC